MFPARQFLHVPETVCGKEYRDLEGRNKYVGRYRN